MIKYLVGNIFDSEAQALVNTVNTVGVMGKGIALQFKKTFPSNFKAYYDATKTGNVEIGKIFVYKDNNLNTGEKLIINFPTKKHWKNPSEYSYIEEGLNDLIRVIEKYNIRSIAIPPLGAGNGGLEWTRVRKMIEDKLGDLNIDLCLYEPTSAIKEKLKTERVKLTNARALLLYVLFDMVKQGEYVSEFSSEKISYFLQRFGAKKHFKLTYQPNFYGPYSGKVRFLLNILNGSYLMGYSDMDKKPFEPLSLLPDAYNEVKEKVESSEELFTIAKATTQFLNGFYSDFALELLSSVDYIAQSNHILDKNLISNELEKWSDRKRSMFSDSKYLDISIKHLEKSCLAF